MSEKKINDSFILMLFFLLIHAQSHANSSGCSAVSVSPPVFPPVSSGSGVQASVITPVSFECTDKSALVTIDINRGLHSTNTRNLFLGGVNIPYTITNGVNPWGDGTPGLGNPVTTSQNGSPLQANFTVTVPTNIPSGHYTDQINIGITYSTHKSDDNNDDDGKHDNQSLGVSNNTEKRITTINLSLSIIGSCTISSAPTAIDFGIVPPGANSRSQASTIGITCSNNLQYFWGADGGRNWSQGTRRMKAINTANFIGYFLQEGGSLLGDSGLENHCEHNDTTGISSRTAVGNAQPQTYTITATIPSIPPAASSDTYVDTVNYYVAW